jgi:hypothetical protein
MAGTQTILNSTTQTATNVVELAANLKATGCASNMVFLMDIVTITGTWDVSVYWSPEPPASAGALPTNSILVATLATITTTGVKNLVIQAPFDGVNRAVPIPNYVQYVEQVAGTLGPFQLYMFTGD